MRTFLKGIFLILLSVLIASPAFGAGATFSRVKTWASGETLTAADLNAEYNNILNNLDATGVGGDSASASAMQATVDPYPAASPSLATSIQGELRRIRYVIAQITGETYWYIDPDLSLASIPAAIQASSYNYAADAGSTDAYAITLSPVPSAYAAGMMVNFKAATFNTTASTLNVNTLGAVAIKKHGGQDLATGDIRSGQMVSVIHDGTNFQLLTDPGEPVGSTRAWHMETVPQGYLECNGASLLRASYPELFAVLGTTYGTADGTHFNLPDLRGTFVRGWDHAKGTDPDRATRTATATAGATMTAGDHVGTEQAAAVAAHAHSTGMDFTASATTSAGAGLSLRQVGTSDTGSYGGNETRPVNTNVMWIIKY